MSSPTNKSSYAFISLFFVLLLDSVGFGIIFPVLSPLFMATDANSMLSPTVSFTLRELLYGITMGVFSISMLLSAPMLGDLSDHFGRKKVILWCLVGTAISVSLCALGIHFKSVIIIIIGRILGGMMAGSQSVAQAAIIDLSTAHNKAKNLGLIAAGNSIGWVVGPILGGYLSDPGLVSWFTYTTPFIVTAILGILNVLMLLGSFQETFISNKKFEFKAAKIFIAFKEAIQHPQIRKLSYVFLLSELAWAVYFQYIPLYFVALFKISTSQIGLFMAFVGVIFGITTAVILRLLVRIISERNITLLGLIIGNIGLFVIVFAHSLQGLWLVSLLVVVGMALSFNTILVLFSNAVSHEVQGKVMGMTTSLVALSWIIGALLIGIFAYFPLVLPFIAAGIFQLLSILLLVKNKDLK